MDKKILVPIDGSDASMNALKYAVKMAEVIGSNAVIAVLEVININKYEFAVDSIDFSIQDRLLEERKREVDEHINKAKKMCKDCGVKFEGVSRKGFPHEEIIKHVEENEEIMLVVMGTSGKGLIDRYVLGSVTGRVVHEVSRKLPCPVMITPYNREVKSIRWRLNDEG